MRLTLFGEIITMAFDTVRTNKMRSALTVLGVVIGITSIVGMTAMIRGFDQSLRDMIRAVGPNTIFVQRFGVTSFASGAEFRDLLKRPNLSITDARAIEDQAETIQLVDIELGAGGPPTQRRVFYRDQKTRPIVVFGTSENFAEGTRIPLLAGRFFNGTEVQYRKNVVVMGNAPFDLLFGASGTDALGKSIRVGTERFEVVGVFDKRPAAGGFNLGQDDFVVIPYTAYQRIFGLNAVRVARNATFLPIQIAMVPRDGVAQEDAIADVERVMRIRHGLRLDQPNDFDILTQDAFLKLWDQISQGTFFALIVISSIALMVGGHRRDGHHVHFGDRANARDRRQEGARGEARRNPFPVPDGGGVSHLAGRAPRHRTGQRHRVGGTPCLGVPDFAAVVVVRHRHRVFGVGRPLLRDVPGRQGLSPRPDRSSALRITRPSARRPTRRATPKAEVKARHLSPLLTGSARSDLTDCDL
jgi:putative ABC transport system permease protein